MRHNWFPFGRRKTRCVQVGGVGLGGENPIRVQSMLTSDTMDTEACVREALGLVESGCEIVRITAPTVKDARYLGAIREALRSGGQAVPLVADIHFKPEAAMEAVHHVEKVRINPGNFADSKKFVVKEYTDEQYAAEVSRIRDRFLPLVELCRERGVAMRIGTNHGSLSDRIMNRYGDTPLGMVESALEFARIAREAGYHEIVFSMKASNPKVMIAAYRLLVDRLDELGQDWNYPLHLGVTEAGDGEDGRIKSAIGIGSLLADGCGDTIRVSLTEDSVREIPVARALAEMASSLQWKKSPPFIQESGYLPDPYSYSRRASITITLPNGLCVGGSELVRVITPRERFVALAEGNLSLGEFRPEAAYEDLPIVELNPLDFDSIERLNAASGPQMVAVSDGLDLPVIGAYRVLAARLHPRHPILLKDTLDVGESFGDAEQDLLASSAILGSLLCDGIGDAIMVRRERDAARSIRLAYNILQASGVRIFKTDYVACPSCGRTLFNLQETTARIKAATSHLKGVRIAVMGCIVNGPGEMADADFGYVGGAPGKINLYVGKMPVKFNIPQEEAVERLVDLIREHGRWVEPGTGSQCGADSVSSVS